MALPVRLTDGTVVEVNSRYMKRWKKFEGYELFIATLVALIPALEPELDETMYCFLSDDSLAHFLTACLGVQMVFARYSCLPEYAFDDFYGAYEGQFNLYVTNDGVYTMCEGLTAYQFKQLTVSPKAVSNLQSLLSSLEIVERHVEEKIVSIPVKEKIIDTSPTIVEPTTSTTVYSCIPPPCNASEYCELCPVLDAMKPGDKTNLSRFRPSPVCLRLRYDPQPLETVFARASRIPGRIRFYGNSFMEKVPDIPPSNVHELEVDCVRLRIKRIPPSDSGICLSGAPV